MTDRIKIEGIDELSSFLQNHTKELDKSVLQSLTKGSRLIKNEIVSRMPGNLQKFKSIIGSKNLTNSANPTVLVGVFGRKLNFVNRRGVKWDPFMLVYWANYGTMANRDGSHTFQSSRRSVSRNKKGGIKPLNFFEKAIDSSMDSALSIAADDIDKTMDIVASKFGFK